MLRNKAIALCRVSTKKQFDDGNTDPQHQRILDAASYLEVEVVKWWELAVSSRKGKNIKRHDLREMLDYCKAHRDVGYLIVDEVDRFMRSIQEYYWWKVEFQNLGVQLRLASRPDADPESDRAIFDELIDIYRAEQSNNERIIKTPEKQMAKMKDGYYPFPPLPGYKKSDTKSLHDIDDERFYLLQEAFKSIASQSHSLEEALKHMTNKGYLTVNGQKMDMARFKNILAKPYYAGIIQVSNWPVATKNGLHKKMISEEEHEAIRDILSGKRKKFIVNRKNPNFPMNETLCYECSVEQRIENKFTGYRNHNGKQKDITKRKYYYRYRCRGCNTYFTRDDLHKIIDVKLKSLKFFDKQQLKNALQTIWRLEVQDNTNQLNALNHKIAVLEESQSSLAIRLAATSSEVVIKAIEMAIKKNEVEIRTISSEKLRIQNNEDLNEFIKFAIEYTEEIKENYWKLNWEDRKRCEDLLFPAGFYIKRDKKVYTPKISAIYRFESMKKEPVKALSFSYGGPGGT